MKKSVMLANQPAANDPAQVEEVPPHFEISNHGTVSLFHPLSNRADDWLRLHCPRDGEHQYLGKAIEALVQHEAHDVILNSFSEGRAIAKADAHNIWRCSMMGRRILVRWLFESMSRWRINAFGSSVFSKYLHWISS